jgi:hypothetical protein
MANTYMQIGNTVTVGAGGSAQIAFFSIPSSYMDLKLVLSARQSGSALNAEAYIFVNNDNSALYATTTLVGSGSAVASGSGSANGAIISFQTPAATATANVFGNAEINIADYSASKNKSFSIDEVCENNGATADMRIMSGLYNSTNAITSVQVNPTSGTFVQYSTASLYGIKKN